MRLSAIIPRIIAQPKISISTKLLAKAGSTSRNTASSHSTGWAWNVADRFQAFGLGG